jgi:hypothetical protein
MLKQDWLPTTVNDQECTTFPKTSTPMEDHDVPPPVDQRAKEYAVYLMKELPRHLMQISLDVENMEILSFNEYLNVCKVISILNQYIYG